MNAILSANEDLSGSLIFATHFPCSQCAGAIIQKKIGCVIIPQQKREFLDRWEDAIKHTMKMFKEVETDVIQYSAEENRIDKVRCSYPWSVVDDY